MPLLNNILFLDVETVPQYPAYTDVPENWKPLWSRKAESLIKDRENDNAETIYNKAAIFPEFGKIVCVSCGIVSNGGDIKKIALKSFYGSDEKLLLSEFSDMLSKWGAPDKVLCAHNGKEFDFPYLIKRMIINRVPIPDMLHITGKKPWEIPHLDTLELWKFGDFKSTISLNLLACSLDIPTPKDDIDGSMVWRVFWEDNDLQRIVTYCQKDVVTVAQIYLRLQGEEKLIAPENIEIK
jgi:DNA polymerase elongation subunit (family B)